MTIRHGGLQTARGFLFELTGGALCLDFANTVDERPTDAPKDHLATYADLLSWGAQSGALGKEEAATLQRRAARSAAEAGRALARVREVREAIFSIFADRAAGRRPGREALDVLEAALPGALGRLRIVPAGEGFAWGWRRDEGALDAMLWPVIRSAADLLTSGDLPRVRRCASPTCAWLFLDRSRNGTRRWCDMTVCGNREKARRFHRRAKRPE
jgi:predicted RNA-binding Zn ribbon-like protein